LLETDPMVPEVRLVLQRPPLRPRKCAKVDVRE
jgi:hypothetical protein